MPKRLSLMEARKKKRLKAFISQEERRVKLADDGAFTGLLNRAIKAPQSKRQTSRSQGGSGSPGK